MNFLPTEVVQHILSFASIDGLLASRRVCKDFAKLIDSDVDGIHLLRPACLRADWNTLDPLPNQPFADGDNLLSPPSVPTHLSPWFWYCLARQRRWARIIDATALIQACIRRDMYFMPPAHLEPGCTKADLVHFESVTKLTLSVELKAWFVSDSGVKPEHRLGRPLSKIGIVESLRIWEWMQSYDGEFTVVIDPATGQRGGKGLNCRWIPYMSNADWREVWCVAEEILPYQNGFRRYSRKVKYYADTNTWLLSADNWADDYVQLSLDWQQQGMFRALSQHGLLTHMDNTPGVKPT